MTGAVRIAVCQALDGHVTVCGPHDFSEKDCSDAMEQAISWHLEAGHLPAAIYWVEVELPPTPSVPELRAKAERGEYPKSFVEEMDAQ